MRRQTASVVALLLLAAGCSGSASFSIGGESPERAAEKLIEGELADSIGLGALDAQCASVEDAAVGSEFTCTGTTADGEVVDFITVIDREDHIDVNSTNLIVADRLPLFETTGADVLGQELGVEFPADTIDCGDDAVVFGADLVFVCAFRAPDGSGVYDITFELPDLESGDFSVEVADTPRG